jgi:hypothetical protein
MREQQDIRIWDCRRAPEYIRQLAHPAATWVAVIPAALACAAVEALFLRWSTETHPVTRHDLADGSVMFSGAHPTAEMMSSDTDEAPTAHTPAHAESRSQKA